ncbi:MAG: hypothetical protein IJ659_08675 [Alloprevotella sp.]|nr:hypothetical protein [Alloprevotella sp.]
MRKLTTLLTLLLLTVVGAMAQSYTIDVDYEHGTFYRYKNGYTMTQNTPGSPYNGSAPVDNAGSPSSNYGAWAYKWVSAYSSAPTVTVIADVDNHGNKFETTTHQFTSGTNLTWSIEVEEGYRIMSYSIEGTTESGTFTLTPEGQEATNFTTSGGSLTVDGLSSSSVTFKTTGGGSDVRLNYTKFQVRVAKLVTVDWESYSGWTRNNVASVWWVGITTPGTTADTYMMSQFQFAQETGYGAATRYACISTTGPTSAGAVLDEADVLAVSTNSVTATAQEYYTYQLADEIELTGATTYYMVFLTSNEPTDGKYTVGTQRVSLNTSYGTYVAGTMASNGVLQSTWTPGFKATLSTFSSYNVNYTCKSTVDNSTITTGSFEGVVGAISAPDLTGYVFDHATTSDGESYTITSDVTSDLDLILYYAPLYDVTYNVYFDGTLKGTETVQQAHGTASEVPESFKRAYAQYAYDVTEITASTEVNATVTFNLPFVTSTDFATAKWYYLQQHTTNKRYNYTDSSNACKWATSNAETENYQWAFVGNGYDGVKVINKGSGDGLYMKDAASITMNEDGTVWSIDEINDTRFCLYNAAETIGDGKYINSRSAGMGKWNSNDAGSQMWVIEVPTNADQYLAAVEEANALITLNTNAITAKKSDEVITALTATLGVDPNSATEDDVQAVRDAISAVLAADPVSLAIPDGTYLIVNGNRYPYMNADAVNGEEVNGANNPNWYESFWNIKTVDGGVTIQNAITGKYIPLPAISTHAVLTSTPTTLAVSKSSSGNPGFFSLGNLSAYRGLHMSGSGTLVGWTSGGASDWTLVPFEDVTDFSTMETNAATAAASLMSNRKSNLGDVLLRYKEAPVSDVENNEYAAYQSSPSMESYAAYVQAILAVEKNLPVDGAYYRIYNLNKSNAYIRVGDDSNCYADDFDGNDLTNLWQFVKNGSYYHLFNPQTQTYLGATGVGSSASQTPASTSGVDYELAIRGDGFSLHQIGCSYLMQVEGSNNHLTGWSTNAAWQAVEVTDATVDITLNIASDGNSYATYYSPFGLTLGSGVVANAVSVNGESAAMEALESALAPLTPVLLVSEDGATSVTAVITPNVEATTTTNALEGTLVEKSLVSGQLVLAEASGKVGFYTLADGYNLGANKAYLVVPEGVRSLVLTQGTTGISSILNAENNGVAYDLQGRRVLNAQKGLYILNGKKVLVK